MGVCKEIDNRIKERSKETRKSIRAPLMTCSPLFCLACWFVPLLLLSTMKVSSRSSQRNQWDWPRSNKKAQLRFLHALRLSKEEITATKSNLHRVVRVVHRDTSLQNINVDRVTTCGSVGKKTVSSHSQDLDLVVYLNDIAPEDLPGKMDAILTEIENKMDKRYPGCRDTDWYRKFGLRYKIQGMEIDILIGVTNFHPLDFLDIQDEHVRAYLSASVSHLNKRLLQKQHMVYHDLVRVVKYWRDSFHWEKDAKPKSYLLEILMLEAFRQLGYCTRKGYAIHERTSIYWSTTQTKLLVTFFKRISKVEPFNPALKKHYSATNLPDLFVWFSNYYQYSDLPLSQPKPIFMDRNGRRATAVVLDPVNPSNNLWQTLKKPNSFVQRARTTLASFLE